MVGRHSFLKLGMAVMLALSFFVSAAQAEQTFFQKRYINGRIDFQYQWRSVDGSVLSTHFQVPQRVLEQADAEFQAFDNSALNKAVLAELRKFARQNSRGGVEIKVRSGFNDEVEMGISAPSNQLAQQLLAQMKQIGEQVKNQALYDAFYKKGEEPNTIMPDHTRIAVRYAAAYFPVARALADSVRHLDQRARLNALLSFFQSIPYDTLQNRYTSNGAGFQTPYALLQTNKGDCDTKSVALASAIRAIYPNARMIMVYVPGHAFIGIDVGSHKPDDFVLKIGGRQYVLSEPAGPGILPFGMITPRSEQLLQRRDYFYEVIR